MAGFIDLVILVLIIYLVVHFVRRRNRPKFLNEKKMVAAEITDAREVAALLGSTPVERMHRVRSAFEQRTATLWSTYYGEIKHWTQGQRSKDGNVRYAFFRVTRNLANMDNRELAYLEMAEILNAWEGGNNASFRRWRTALLWGDGRGSYDRTQWSGGFQNADEAVRAVVVEKGMTVDQIVGEIERWAAQRVVAADVDATFREYLQEFLGRTSPTGGGAWLKGNQVAASPFAARSPYALHLGTLADGSPLSYSGDGSIVTIAPP